MAATAVGDAGWIGGLLDAAAYTHSIREPRLVETHISWVLLTGEYAYKIKKPLKLPFLDFSTLEQRRQACCDELRLNRRFAPDLYLEVVPISGGRTAPRMGASGAPFEYAVKMRQFPAEQQLDRLLAADALSPDDMKQFGAALADIHQALPTSANGKPWGEPARIHAQVFDCVHDLLQSASDAAIRSELQLIGNRLRRRHAALAQLMVARERAGRIRECHGDLHLANLVKSAHGIVPFDCIEFSEELRWIDVISDAAFLAMDLVHRDRAGLAYVFLNSYVESCGDYEGLRMLRYYAAYRALVRAKIAMIRYRASAGTTRDDADECAAYLRQARHWTLEGRPGIVLMHGLSGSGKTIVSEELMTQLPAIRVRSDVERKRLHGLHQHAHSGSAPDGGLYTVGASERVYARLAEAVRDINNGGETAIVDATFLDAAVRGRFTGLADELGAPWAILHCTAPQEELERRVAGRERRGEDASEATVEVLRRQAARQSPLSEAERRRTLPVDTTRPLAMGGLCAQLRDLLR